AVCNGRPEPPDAAAALRQGQNCRMRHGRARRRIHILPSQKRMARSKATVEPLTMPRWPNESPRPAREPAASESSTSTRAKPDPADSPGGFRNGVHRTAHSQKIRMSASDHEASESVRVAQ